MGARVIWLCVVLLIGLAAPAAAQPAKTAAAAYITGMEALDAGKYREAAAAFSQAVEVDNENIEYIRARGVARVLAEDFQNAIADLQRAIALSRERDREAKVWLAAAYSMSGDPMKGSMYFTHGGDVPAGYANLIYNEMAATYWSSRTHGTYFDKTQNRQVQVNGPVRTKFPEAAHAYVQRHAATDQASAAARADRMQASTAQGDWPAVIKDLSALRRASPDDMALRARWATALLRIGNASDAREEYTRVLSAAPEWAEGYVGRAEAAAILGDARRVNADLRSAAQLGKPADEATKARIEKLLGGSAADEAPQRFAGSVKSDAAIAQLIEQAVALHRWFNARRIRYDEGYQDRVLAMDLAIRNKPNDPDRPELLARFLQYNSNPPSIWNGVRGGGQKARPQSDADKKREINRAYELAESALKIDPRHINAIATKGWLLYDYGRSNDAWQQSKLGLDVEPRHVRLLRLAAQILVDEAGALEAQANALLAGHTETSRETRSDGVYEVTRHYPPTAAQVAQAQANQARAAALRQDASQKTATADNVHNTVVPGLIKQGDDALARNDLSGAERALRAAYTLDCNRNELMQKLAELHKRRGDPFMPNAFLLAAEPLRETTAAPELKAAWEEAMRTAWRSSGEALDRAAALDPADARVPAFRSAVLVQTQQPVEADRARRAAIALEEARAKLTGDSYFSSQPTALGGIDAQDAALILLLRLRSGESDIAAGRNERAVEILRANVAIEQRMNRDQIVQLAPSAMLPEPHTGPTVVPEAPTIASVIAMSRIGLGRAYQALGRPNDAREQYQAVRGYMGNWPATSDNSKTLFTADNWAKLGLAESAYASRSYEEAWRLLLETPRFNMPEDFVQRRQQLEQKVEAARRGGSGGGGTAPGFNIGPFRIGPQR
jgi:tetratricopeptide (TPR) repeat protein